MSYSLLFSLLALLSLLPITMLAMQPGALDREIRVRLLLLVALVGSLCGFLGPLLSGSGWPAGFSAAIWLSLTATTGLVLLVGLRQSGLFRLLPLLMPYLLLLALLATLWSGTAKLHRLEGVLDGLFWVHVSLSLLTYGAATLAAVAGVAVLIQQQALKEKRPTNLSRSLPALADGERLQHGFLLAAEGVLGIGILTGMAIRVIHDQTALPFDHKTVLSLLAFGLIGLLLILQARSGMRGQRTARMVLAAYLVLTLGYPGVKFITDVIMA